jgi:hypothetical protein
LYGGDLLGGGAGAQDLEKMGYTDLIAYGGGRIDSRNADVLILIVVLFDIEVEDLLIVEVLEKR